MHKGTLENVQGLSRGASAVAGQRQKTTSIRPFTVARIFKPVISSLPKNTRQSNTVVIFLTYPLSPYGVFLFRWFLSLPSIPSVFCVAEKKTVYAF